MDKPENSKVVSEDKETGIVERESSWTGIIEGFDSFPSGTIKGQGSSIIFNNKISISHWQ